MSSTGRTVEAETERQVEFTRPGRVGALWFGVVGGPLVALANEGVNYAAAPWACESGARLPLHVVSAVALAVVVAAGLVALRDWRDAGDEWDAQAGTPVARSRFMAIVGMTASALSALVIIAQWLAVMLLDPCVLT